MKPFRMNIITPFAFVGVLALATSACDEAGDASASEQVATLDALATLGPTPEELPLTGRTTIFEGAMHLCVTGDSYEVRIARGRQDGGGACEAFPMEWVNHESAFSFVDVTIDGTVYPANEVHLVRRVGEWLLFLEGAHDQSVTREHYGSVFQIGGGDEIELVSKCTGHIWAADEDLGVHNPYVCIRDQLHPLDLALVKWEEDDSCVIDYSICDAPSA